MNGNILKERLQKIEPNLSSAARKLGMSKQAFYQALEAADVKTGLIEKLSAEYNCPIEFFFKEQQPFSLRLIGEVKEGSKATQGDNSPIYESGMTEESLTVDIKLPEDLEGSHKEIRRLMRKLKEKDMEYAKLEGKYEELDRLFRDVLRGKT